MTTPELWQWLGVLVTACLAVFCGLVCLHGWLAMRRQRQLDEWEGMLARKRIEQALRESARIEGEDPR